MTETYKKLPAITLTDEIIEELPGGDKAVRISGTMNVVEADVASIGFVRNIAIPLAGTEYSFAFPDDTKRFIVKVRETDTVLNISYASGGEYFTLLRANVYEEQAMLTNGVTLYFVSNKPARTLEIVYWV